MNPPRARAFGSLRSRNVRVFLGGQSVSLVGTWIQQVAMGWLAYRLTGSPLLLGVLAAAGQLPSLLLMPIAGGLSDRWSRHRILIVTQSLAMGLTLVLAALALAGVVAVWHLVTIGALLGVVGALDVPARQAFVADMVESREDVGNAVALHASVTNAARLIGPSIGGAIVARAGEGVCFLVNGASYAAALARSVGDHDRVRRVRGRSRAGPVRFFRRALAVARSDVRHRTRRHAPARLEQRADPDRRGGRSARAGDGPLHDGVRRPGAGRHAAGGDGRHKLRCRAHGAAGRVLLSRGLARVRPPPPRRALAYPPTGRRGG